MKPTYLRILLTIPYLATLFSCSIPQDRENIARLCIPGTILLRSQPERTDVSETFIILTKDSTEIVTILVTSSKSTYIRARIPIQQYCKRE